MTATHELTQKIKAEALRLGFSACGVAKAEPVDAVTAERYHKWLAEGNHASMTYLENNLDKRLDPTLLMPGAKSIISLAMNYYPAQKLRDDQFQFAYYAYGKDYHDVLKQRMRKLLSSTSLNSVNSLLCVDTVPILDRYWAYRAGLGWIGKNGCLIIPHAGSFFFLAEILTDIELEYDTPIENHCGNCHQCLDACPTGALQPHTLDARKCLSYLTIEHRGDFPDNDLVAKATGKGIYGCDRCQLACPHNRFAQPTCVSEFAPSQAFLSMRPDDWKQLTVEQYRTLFKGSAVKRAKYEGLIRNISYAQQAEGNHETYKFVHTVN